MTLYLPEASEVLGAFLVGLGVFLLMEVLAARARRVGGGG
jgi:hypothetical protein